MARPKRKPIQQKRPMVRRKKGAGVKPPPITNTAHQELRHKPPLLRADERGQGSGPLPGKDVTVVQTGEKTLFIRKGKDPDAPKGGDPLIYCKKCKVWSARRNYCSNCKEERNG